MHLQPGSGVGGLGLKARLFQGSCRAVTGTEELGEIEPSLLF